MPIPKRNARTEKCCGNCFMAYRTRFEHHTVIRCKQWNDKLVTMKETCDKHVPIISHDGMPER